jgi:hypothetical protein
MKVFDCRNEELSAVAALFRVESVKQCRALGTNTIKPELFIDKISELFGAFAETSKLWPKSLFSVEKTSKVFGSKRLWRATSQDEVEEKVRGAQ